MHESRSAHPLDFCRIVRGAGGVPVLAHPGYLYRRVPDGFIPMLNEMKACGIGGVECYYPSHSKEITDTCLGFCRRNDLRISGGCDCHGDFDKTEGFTIGALDISKELLDLRGII